MATQKNNLIKGKKHEYKTKYRIIPLNFGEYNGEKTFDFEEVGIATKEMSFEDYLSLRSIALMIDQRVSEGIKSKFFSQDAYTTTIPAQFVKKFNCKVVPIHIERTDNINFIMRVFDPIQFKNNDTIDFASLETSIPLGTAS